MTRPCPHRHIVPVAADDRFRCLDCRELLHRREVKRSVHNSEGEAVQPRETA